MKDKPGLGLFGVRDIWVVEVALEKGFGHGGNKRWRKVLKVEEARGISEEGGR